MNFKEHINNIKKSDRNNVKASEPKKSKTSERICVFRTIKRWQDLLFTQLTYDKYSISMGKGENRTFFKPSKVHYTLKLSYV